MKVAVIGASGFVGINLASTMLTRGHSVLCISLDPMPAAASAHLASLDAPSRFEIADVLDDDRIAFLLRSNEVEALFHGGTITAAMERERSSFARIIEVNVLGTARVLEAAARAGVRQVVLASSSAVYGEGPFLNVPLSEDRPVTPVTLYGITKLAAEQAALRFSRVCGLSVRVIRIAAVFGAWERDTGVRDTLSPFFQIAHQALAGEVIRLPSAGARDWIDVTNVAYAIAELLERDHVAHTLYNFAAASPWHPREFCKALGAVMPVRWDETDDLRDVTVDFRDDLSRQRRALETARAAAEFGAACLRVGQPSIAGLANWVHSHPGWFSVKEK
jgi:nucleoside-diphosphate-sugar epimerase